VQYAERFETRHSHPDHTESAVDDSVPRRREGIPLSATANNSISTHVNVSLIAIFFVTPEFASTLHRQLSCFSSTWVQLCNYCPLMSEVLILPMRCYVSIGISYRPMSCLCCVCLPHASIVSKWLHVSADFWHTGLLNLSYAEF